MQPGAHRGAAFEGFEPPPGTQERLLGQVFGILERAEHAVAVDADPTLVRFDERSERLVIGVWKEPRLGGAGFNHRRATSLSGKTQPAPDEFSVSRPSVQV